MNARAIAAAFACASALTPRLEAQHDSVLVLAVRRATEGLGDSARALVRARLRGLQPTDSLYAEALYVQGVVAANADSAAASFRRVAYDFGISSWADDALLRLGQLAFAAGDVSGAQRSFERILTDYPASNVRAQAQYWSARVRLEAGDIPGGCQRLGEARDAASADVELANQIGFYLQRCANLPTATPPPAPPPTVGDTTKTDSGARGRPRPVGSFFAVQVAAVRTAAQADDVMRSLKTQGYTARVTREADGLLHVRVGHFPTKAEADRLAREVKRKVGGSPFVVDDQ